MTTPRQTIISRLKAGKDIDEWADLCIYPSGSLFVVEFVPPSGPLDVSGLSKEHAAELRDEGELAEYCETPEEAADFYLLLESTYKSRLVAQKDVMREDAPRKPRPAPARKVAPVQLPSVDEASFQEEVGSSAAPVVVLFWSPWSAADRLLLPAFAKLAATQPDVRFMTMDAEEAPTVSQALALKATPTVILFRDGGIHARIDAPITEDALCQALATLPR